MGDALYLAVYEACPIQSWDSKASSAVLLVHSSVFLSLLSPKQIGRGLDFLLFPTQVNQSCKNDSKTSVCQSQNTAHYSQNALEYFNATNTPLPLHLQVSISCAHASTLYEGHFFLLGSAFPKTALFVAPFPKALRLSWLSSTGVSEINAKWLFKTHAVFPQLACPISDKGLHSPSPCLLLWLWPILAII